MGYKFKKFRRLVCLLLAGILVTSCISIAVADNINTYTETDIEQNATDMISDIDDAIVNEEENKMDHADTEENDIDTNLSEDPIPDTDLNDTSEQEGESDIEQNGETEETGGNDELPEDGEEEAPSGEDEQEGAVYDEQPTSAQDVHDAIDKYNNAMQALENNHVRIMTEPEKPKWQFEVPEEWMPFGYESGLVEDDEDFGLPYYTFFMRSALFTGVGTYETPFEITNAEDLVLLASMVTNNTGENNGFPDTYFVLKNNIDLTEYLSAMLNGWIGIGSQTYPFRGSFDGKGLTISGLQGTDQESAGKYGLFGKVNHAQIINLKVELGGDLSANYDIGGLVGLALNGTVIENCSVNGNGHSITATGGGRAAGLVGWTNEDASENAAVIITNSYVDNVNIITSGNYAAGFVGVAYNARIKDCGVSATTTAFMRDAGAEHIGGFAGALHGSSISEKCYVKNSIVSGTGSSGGGFAGIMYDKAKTYGCYVENPQVKIDAYAGGFAGKIHNASAINCYAADGRTISTSIAGGFAGELASSANIINCYAQVDVTTHTTIAGGLVGYHSEVGTNSIANCYATGSVSGTDKVGGLIGEKRANSSVTNTYATGTVSGTGRSLGGLIGYTNNVINITNNFFDTTTTRQNKALGNRESNGVTGLTTTEMLNRDRYRAWNVRGTSRGAAGASGSEESPWYIDNGITYPYLYYQYDGHSVGSTNYYIASTSYNDGTGLDHGRADFTITKDSLPLKVASAGAAYAYFPYSGTSRHSISTGSQTSIPGAKYNDKLYSLGGVSKTNIIAFSGYPYAEKTSDRPKYIEGQEQTYTYTGDTVTYTIAVSNYSYEADWKKIMLTDFLMPGRVSLIEGSVMVNGMPISKDTKQIPYYLYDEVTGLLSVYLPDLAKAHDTNSISKHVLEYQVFVGQDAAAGLDGNWIRNRGVVTGELLYPGVAEKEIEVSFDDKNTDPVFTKHSITYNSNSVSQDETVEVLDNYYVPGSDVKIKHADDLGFAQNGYVFLGWNTSAEGDGKAFQPEEILVMPTENITLYAQWEKTLSSEFFFYKMDAEFNHSSLEDPASYFLEGAEFILYRESDDNWVQYANAKSGANGLVSFGNLPTGNTYLLKEVQAPSGYQLPGVDWIIEVSDQGMITLHGSETEDIHALVIQSADINKELEGDELYIVNYYKSNPIPLTGGEGIRKFVVPGGVLLVLGALGIWHFHAIKNKKEVEK